MLIDDYICHAWILGLGPVEDFQPLEYFKQENSLLDYLFYKDYSHCSVSNINTGNKEVSQKVVEVIQAEDNRNKNVKRCR